MPLYRVYVTDEAGRITTPATVIECANDEQALAEAKALSVGPKLIEVWQGSRRVSVLPATGSPSPTQTQ
jgi:hypothetical protein